MKTVKGLEKWSLTCIITIKAACPTHKNGGGTLKKKIISVVLSSALSLSLTVPCLTYAQADVDRQISDIQQKIKTSEAKQQRVKAQLGANKEKQHRVKQTIAKLQNDLAQTKQKIGALNREISENEGKLEKLKRDLIEAEKRIDERSALLNDRIRLLYEKGKMSYLEVLFKADSFRDFLVRFDAVRSISEQDKELLEQNRKDKQIVQTNKVKIEHTLVKLSELQEKAKEERRLLASQEKAYKVQLASLQREYEELDDISEREAEEIRQLVGQLARAKAEKEAQMRREEERKRREAEQQRTLAAAKPKIGEKEGRRNEQTLPAAKRPAPERPAPAKRPATPVVTSGFAWPVPGYGVSSPFGWRNGRMHKGIDIAGPGILGKPILAAADGEVIEARPANGYGNIVVIYHGDGLSTLYAHMPFSSIKVRRGDRVSKGQVIANVGNEGRSSGPHLHFEVLKYNTPVNPMNYY